MLDIVPSTQQLQKKVVQQGRKKVSFPTLDVKYAKWSIKYAEIHVFSGCEQIHSKYTVKYTGGRHVIVTAATS